MGEHLVWIDWMKVIGMYFIIVGHFFPIGNQCIYMFSVPLFFFISGYLTKSVDSDSVFYNKLYHNLILPLLLICAILYLISIVTSVFKGEIIHSTYLYKYWVYVFLGDQGEKTGTGLGACWFIYTLILVKIIAHYAKRFNWIIVTLFCGAAYYLNYRGLYFYSSWANAILAYPFFLTGAFLQKKNILNSVSYHFRGYYIIILLLLFWGISTVNGRPMMYCNYYGNDFFLSYFGGLLGIFIIYILCSKLEKMSNKYVCTISNGTIIILGFHGLFITAFYELNEYIHLYLAITAYLFSAIILLLFYPIIISFGKKLPIFLGNRKIF